MRASVYQRFLSMTFGEPQSDQGFTLIPIIAVDAPALEYRAAGAAIAEGRLQCREIEAGARVPEIDVQNESESLLLLLSGEELKGARQNRVVNTSILIPGKSKLTIPVSCTEHGRWSYEGHRRPPRRSAAASGAPTPAGVTSHAQRDAHAFQDSGIMMSKMARHAKHGSVSQSLRTRHTHASDQGRVWDEVAQLHRKLGSHSATGAMRDGFVARGEELSRWFNAFPVVLGQCGFVAAHRGRVLGLEYVSRPDTYGYVHERLVKSYLVDYLNDKGTATEEIDVAQFVRSLDGLGEEAYAAVGYGEDLRYSGPGISGSALVHDGEVVHAVFLVRQPDEGQSTDDRHRHRSTAGRRHEGPAGNVGVNSAETGASRRKSTTEATSAPHETETEALRREQRRQRLHAHRKWQETFLKLPAHLQLELIAWDTQHPLGFYPPQSANASKDVLASMDADARTALLTKTISVRKGHWQGLAEQIRSSECAPSQG
jgi:hypothetical protein